MINQFVDIRVDAVGHREHDHGARQVRVEITDRRTLEPVISLTPSAALALSRMLANAVTRAELQSVAPPGQDRV